MKSVFLIALVAVAMIGIMVPSVFAQNVYVQIDELPEWADYASNVMYLSTESWKEANEGLEFWVVENSSDADFGVKWVKDFGGEYVGYAYGNQLIEVGLGDSNCLNKWNPYSEKHISHIMKHEIGHIFGHEHDNNPDSIMYPIALNREYGLVEEEYRLTEGYGQFIPFCTIKDLTSYDFSISTTDETYGFDYYIVPSSNEFDKWVEGKVFQHYSNKDCFGEEWLSISGTCKGVSAGSGIMVLIDSELTTPLVTITVKKLEVPNIINSKSMLASKNYIDFEKIPPTQNTFVPFDEYEEKKWNMEELMELRDEIMERSELDEKSERIIWDGAPCNSATLINLNTPVETPCKTYEEISSDPISNNQCDEGTVLKNNVCVLEEFQVIQTTTTETSEGGGCLIATATYGSELSPQVQQLRELRDNQLMNTESGTGFMSGFNELYYSFSPTIADMQRENPLFKEVVKLAITPMISSLSLMENANSESEVLGLGLSVIALNLGMYLGVPAIVVVGIRKKLEMY